MRPLSKLFKPLILFAIQAHLLSADQIVTNSSADPSLYGSLPYCISQLQPGEDLVFSFATPTIIQLQSGLFSHVNQVTVSNIGAPVTIMGAASVLHIKEAAWNIQSGNLIQLAGTLQEFAVLVAGSTQQQAELDINTSQLGIDRLAILPYSTVTYNQTPLTSLPFISFEGGGADSFLEFNVPANIDFLSVGNGNLVISGQNVVSIASLGSLVPYPLGLIKRGSGTVVIANPVTYTGATTLSEGTMLLMNGGSLNQSSQVFVDGFLDASTLVNTVVLPNLSSFGVNGQINVGSNALELPFTENQIFSGNIVHASKVTMQGLGTGIEFTLMNHQGYTVPTFIENMTLSIAGGGSIASSQSINLPFGANIDISGASPTKGAVALQNLVGSGQVQLGSNTLALTMSQDGSFDGLISGQGSVQKQSSYTYTLRNHHAYTGWTEVLDGTLVVSGGLSTLSSVKVSGVGTTIFDGSQIQDSTLVLANIGGNEKGIISLGSKNLHVNNTVDGIFGGIIQGSGSFLKSGGATLTLSQTQSYSGQTTISSGTLALAGAAMVSPNAPLLIDGTLDITKINASVFTLTNQCSGTGTLNFGGKTLEVQTGETVTFGGMLIGDGVIAIQNSTLAIVNEGGISSEAYVKIQGMLDLSQMNPKTVSFSHFEGTGVLDFGANQLEVSTNSTITFGGRILGTGPIAIQQGTLALIGNGSISSDSLIEIEGALDLSALNIGTVTLNEFSGTGTLHLGVNNLQVTNSGTFIYGGNVVGTGTTRIFPGTLVLVGNGRIPFNAPLIIDGTLDISQVNWSTLTLANQFSGTGAFIFGAKTLEVNTGETITFGGAIHGTGPIAIQQGTLALIGNGSISSTVPLTIEGNLDFSGLNPTLVSLTNFSGTGTLDLGSNHFQVSTSSVISFGGTVLGSGSTHISQGTLALIGEGILPFDVPLIIDGALDISQVNWSTLTLTNQLSGTGILSFGAKNLQVETTGVVTFSGMIEGSGPIQINKGTLAIIGAGGISSDAYIKIEGELDLSNLDLATVALTKFDGTGTLNLGANDLEVRTNSTITFGGTVLGSGSTRISQGTLALVGKGALPWNAPLIIDGILDISQVHWTAFDLTNQLSGTGTIDFGAKNLQVNTTGTVTFAGGLHGTGIVNINSGTLAIIGNGSISSNAALQIQGKLDLSQIYPRVIGLSHFEGTGTLDFGPNQLEVSTNSTITFGGAILGTGPIAIQQGTLALIGNGSIFSNSSIEIDGILDLSALNRGTVTLSGFSGTGTLHLGVKNLDVNYSRTFIYGGEVTGTGTTRISQGTLALVGKGMLPFNAPLIIDGTLDISQVNWNTLTLTNQLSGTGILNFGAKNLQVETTGAVTFGGRILGSGPISINKGTLAIVGAGGISSDAAIKIGGELDLSHLNLATVTLTKFDGTGTLNLGTKNLQVSTSSMITFGGTVLGSGFTHISQGTLALIGKGTIPFNAPLIIDGTLDISQVNWNALTLTNQLSGVGTLDFGAKNLQVETTGTVVFGGRIKGSGPIDINSGTLAIVGTGGISSDAAINIQGELDLSKLNLATVELTKFDGTGTLNLGANNLQVSTNSTISFGGTVLGSGSTHISQGTLALIGKGTIPFNAPIAIDGTLDISQVNWNALTLTDQFSGTGTLNFGTKNLEVNTAGTVTFGGAIKGTGPVNINSGTLAMIGNGSISSDAAIAIEGELDLSKLNLTTVALTKFDGAGTLDIGANNLQISTNSTITFGGRILGTGPIAIQQGTLALIGNGSISADSLLKIDGTLNLSALNAATVTLDGFSGTGTLHLGRKNLDLIYSGTTTYGGEVVGTGTTHISQGTLALIGKGTIPFNAPLIIDGTLDISQVNWNALTLTNQLSGLGTLDFGAKNLQVETTGTVVFGGRIKGSGPIDINSGTLAIVGAGGISSDAAINIQGELDLSKLSLATVELTKFDGTGTLNLGANNLQVSTSSTITFGGTVLGSGSTHISQGTLALVGKGTIPFNAPLTIDGTLDISQVNWNALSLTDQFSGTGTLNFGAKNLDVNTAGTVTFGGMIKGTGPVNINSGTLAMIGNGSISLTAPIMLGGTLDVSGIHWSSVSLTDFEGTGTLNLGANNLQVSTSSTIAFGGKVVGSGATTIAQGTLALIGKGMIPFNAPLAIEGILDISQVNWQILTLADRFSGSGTLYYGAKNLEVDGAQIAFGGKIDGSGSIAIKSGTFAILGNGSIPSTAPLLIDGVLDFSALNMKNSTLLTLTDFSGTGLINCGDHDLKVMTDAKITFGGEISGTGAIIVDKGILALTGDKGLATHSGFEIQGELDLSHWKGKTATLNGLSGTGKLTLNSNNLDLNFSKTSYYGGAILGSGVTTVSQGTLALVGDGRVPFNAPLVINGTLDISQVNGNTMTLTNQLSGSGVLHFGTKNLELQTGKTVIFGGNFVGDGQLKIGNGTLALVGEGSIASSAAIAIDGTLDLTALNTPTVTLTNFEGNGTLSYGSKKINIYTPSSIAFGGNLHGNGIVTIEQGTLALVGKALFPATTPLVINGTLDLTQLSGTSYALSDFMGTGTLALSKPLQVSTSSVITFAGNIAGNGTLIIESGILELVNKNSFVGEVVISKGTALVLSTSGQMTGSLTQSSVISIQNRASLDLSRITPIGVISSIQNLSGSGEVFLGKNSLELTNIMNGEFAGIISGEGALIKSGPGTITLSGVNAYLGSTTIFEGTLAVIGDGAIPFENPIDIQGTLDLSKLNASLITLNDFTGAGKLNLGANNLQILTTSVIEFGGQITGAGSFVMGKGTFALIGSGGINSAEGVHVANRAKIDISGISNSSRLNSAAKTTMTNLFGSGSIDLGANTLEINGNANGQFSGVISGRGSFVKGGMGIFTLSNANTYQGSTTIAQGTLVVTGNGSIPYQAPILIEGTLDLSTLNVATLALHDFSGTGTLSTGAIPLQVATSSIITFGGEILCSSSIAINQGTLALVGRGTVPHNTELVIQGTLDLSRSTLPAIALNQFRGDGSIVIQNPLQVSANTSILFDGNITGAGSVVIEKGVLGFSRSNFYTGITTVSSGATLLLKDSGSIAKSQVVNLMPQSFFDISQVMPRGIISSVQNFSGLGTILLGENTLELSNILNGSFGGVISGAGSFIKSGWGTITLSGVNIYEGSTTISQGTLALVGQGRIPFANEILINGTLDLSGLNDSLVTLNKFSGSGVLVGGENVLQIATSSTITFGGTIQGPKGLEIATGTLALVDEASPFYEGPLKVLGTLDLSGLNHSSFAVNSLSGSGQVVLGSHTLEFNRAGESHFSGNIEGAGGVSISSGSLVLSGVNEYAGPTQILGGMLTLLNANAIAQSSSVVNEGVIDCSQVSFAVLPNLSGNGAFMTSNAKSNQITLENTTALTYEGSFLGNGNIEITGNGSGDLSLVADNRDFQGAFHLAAGKLRINGNYSNATFNVQPNTIVCGVGETGDFSNAGALSPGNSIGTMVISGNYTQSGALHIEIEPNNISDLLHVVGDVTINPGSTLEVIPFQAGVYLKGETFTILTANSISGTFSNYIVPSVFEMSVVYNATNIQLINNEDAVITPVLIPDLPEYAEAAANALFCPAVDLSGDLLNLNLLLLNLPVDAFIDSLRRVIPTQISALPIVELENTNRVLSLLQNRIGRNKTKQLAAVKTTPEWTLWMTPVSFWLWQGATKEAVGFRSSTGGFTLGVEKEFSPALCFGVGAGYTHSALNWSDSFGHSDMNECYLAPYIGGRWKKLCYSASVMGSYDAVELQRSMQLPILSRTATSHFNQWNLGAMFDCRGFFAAKESSFYFSPEGSCTFMQLFREKATESGAESLDMIYPAGFNSTMRLFVNGAFGWRSSLRKGVESDFRGSVGYQNTQLFTSNEIDANFVGDQRVCGGIQVYGNRPSENQGVAALNLSVEKLDQTKVELTSSYTFGGHSSVLECNLSLELKF